jgi:antitoxin component YwqK of YwqJK toxin-antitoxin module|tara:strand:- start:24 stop:692 length:669 start_codon:yes stop_codon:yes gene_type:complete
MKKLLPIIFILIFSSCSKEVSSDKLVERQGVIYEVNSQTPFTGISVEYYLDTIIKNEFEERVLFKRTTFKNGIKNGLYESFHLNTQLKTKGNFINEKEEGLQDKYFVNGQLQEKRNIENGELVLHQTFDKEGNPLKDLIFNNGKKTGVEFTFHDNGQLESKSNYKDGERDGLWEWFYENGQLQFKENYKDGRQDGPFESYYENGQLDERGNYKDGKEDGLWE